MKTTTKILLIVGIFVAVFVVAMVVTFWVKGETPDVLIEYTLGAGGVEALLCAVIKATKVIKGESEDEHNYDI